MFYINVLDLNGNYDIIKRMKLKIVGMQIQA